MSRVAVMEETMDLLVDQYVSKEDLKEHEAVLAEKIASDVAAQVQAARDKKAIARTRTVEAVIIALITAGATVLAKLLGA